VACAKPAEKVSNSVKSHTGATAEAVGRGEVESVSAFFVRAARLMIWQQQIEAAGMAVQLTSRRAPSDPGRLPARGLEQLMDGGCLV
jgi:hypothetical protein